MVRTLTSFERRVCEGAGCAGIRTHLVTQFHPSGVCYACHARANPAGNHVPSARKDWLRGPGAGVRKLIAADHAEMENEVRKEEVGQAMKKCPKCKHDRPDEDFLKNKADGSKVIAKQCAACRQKAMEQYMKTRAPGVKARKPMKKAATGPRTIEEAALALVAPPASSLRNPLILANGTRLFTIAMLGPRPQDHEFVRALCAGILQDSLHEAGVKDLVELSAEEA